MLTTMDLLDRLLDPISRTFTLDSAQRLLSLRADSETQTRMDELAERCNQGQLTSGERLDYESLLSAANMIGILQAKARKITSTHSAA